MTHYYCTIFNSGYLSRGLALFESLKKYDSDFKLLVFAADDLTYKVLQALSDPALVVHRQSDLESPELLRVKSERQMAEYFWTCTPFTILYALEKLGWDHCTYVDADVYFFSSPKPLLDEYFKGDIGIVEHRFSKHFTRLEQSGKYCVQFNFFRRNENGLKALRWWAQSCLEWCYDRYEDGKFGDQKYLDDWTTRFDKVISLQHEGGGLAPWNMEQYHFSKSSPQTTPAPNTDTPVLIQKQNQKWDLIFYHFHALRFYKNERMQLGRYRFHQELITLVYAPYVRHLERIENQLKKWDYKTPITNEPQTLRSWLAKYKHQCFGTYHIYPKSKFLTISSST